MMPVSCKQAATTISRLFKCHLPNTVGLDIGSGAIKIAEVRWTQGNPTLTAIGIEELPANTVRDGYILNKERLAETLQRAWGLHGIESKHVILSLNGQAVFVREIVLPSMDDEELRQAIKWELDKYIPTSDIAKYYFDFAVLGPAKDVNGIRVLLVAAPLDMITGITRTVKEAGLKPSAIDIEPLALQRTMNADNAIVIDIGAECCQLNLFQQGSPLVSRFIPFGGVRFTAAIVQVLELDFYEAEKLKISRKALLSENIQPGLDALQRNFEQLVGDLAREVSRTIDYYQLQNRNAFIDKIILTGGGVQLGQVIDNLASVFAGTQVAIHSPLSMVQISPSLNLERLQEKELQLAVAIGLALRGGDEKYGD